jgi:hypothetical protein
LRASEKKRIRVSKVVKNWIEVEYSPTLKKIKGILTTKIIF